MKTFSTLRAYQQKLALETSAAALFPDPLVLPFCSQRTVCPDCQAPLQVYKTQDRTVRLLDLGRFTAHETLLWCSGCQKVHASELSQLVAPGCTVGYDVLVWVGRALFLRDQRTEDIVAELATRRVHLSESEVGYLARKFVIYLALAHRQTAPEQQSVMRAQGGYILHLDGTCEGGGPMLMGTLDSISQFALGSVKVPSEKAEPLIPFLEEIKARYGVPLATVHDMGLGICAAVQVVFSGVPDFICHFHFLRDLGKDLLEADYDAIRQRLRKHGLSETLRRRARQFKETLDQKPDWAQSFSQDVLAGRRPVTELESFPLRCAYSLIQWVLAGKAEGQGYGFPFDRPHVEFAKRLRLLGQRLEEIKGIHLRGSWQDNKPLLRLSCQLKHLVADEGLQRLLAAIEEKIKVFDQLRSAMRIAETSDSAGLNSGSDPIALGPIQKAVEQFRQQITSRSDYASNRSWKRMIDQIDKYKEKLFADPITVQTDRGPLVLQPQRTNNLMERWFRDFRHGARRRTGQNSISPLLRSMIADTLLVRNLENPAYMKILLQGRATLEERFAQIDIESVRKEMQAAQASQDKVPSEIHKLVSIPTLLETIANLFKRAA